MVQSWNGSEIYWTCGKWNGQFFSLLPGMTASDLYQYAFVESEIHHLHSLTQVSSQDQLLMYQGRCCSGHG